MGEAHVGKGVNMEENKNKVDDIIEELLGGEHTKERVESMKKKADLSDIILEKEKSAVSGAQKKKTIVLSVASLVLLFLIFLIISKMLNSSNDDKAVSNTQSSATEEKIKITDENSNKDSAKTQGSKDSDNKVAKNDTDLKFDELVKKLREQDSQTESAIPTNTKNDDITPKVSEPKKETVTTKETHKKEESRKPKISITSTSTKPSIKPAVKAHKKPVTHTTHRQHFASSANGGFYIQVGASLKPTPNRFLVSKIKNSGYKYSIHPIVIKGRQFYKILVGPFNSKAKAMEEIGRVKATINPRAYIYFLRK